MVTVVLRFVWKLLYTTLKQYSSSEAKNIINPKRKAEGLYQKQFNILRNVDADAQVSGEMGHHDSSLSQPGSFNHPYLEGMSYPGQAYGLYPHHFSKLRSPHDLNGAYGDYPSKQQQAVPTYKWMQVKRNVPKPGKIKIQHFIVLSTVFQ